MNNCVFLGRMTQDAKMQTTGNGKTVAHFSLAVDRRGTDKSDFFNFVAWEKTAEIIRDHTGKGTQMVVRCHAQNGSYEKDGQKRTYTEFVVDEMRMCGGKSASNTNGSSNINEEEIPF